MSRCPSCGDIGTAGSPCRQAGWSLPLPRTLAPPVLGRRRRSGTYPRAILRHDQELPIHPFPDLCRQMAALAYYCQDYNGLTFVIDSL